MGFMPVFSALIGDVIYVSGRLCYTPSSLQKHQFSGKDAQNLYIQGI